MAPDPNQNLGSSSQDNTASKIETLLSNFLYPKELESLVYIPRFKHRLAITDAWSVEPSKRILDIGCGQGESSITLALELGPTSHIAGIDTAVPDYGGPFTVAECHEYVSKSSLAPQITFHLTDVTSLLNSLDQPSSAFDAAVLCHSLWYFPSRDSVFALFETLAAAGIPKVYLAEYTFEPSLPAQVPHVLAAQALALFHTCKAPRAAGAKSLNVRAALEAETILEAARGAGFEVARRGIFTPEADLLEGHFEARFVMKEGNMFADFVRAEKLPLELEDELLAYGPRVKAVMEELSQSGDGKARAMDVWWAELELKP